MKVEYRNLPHDGGKVSTIGIGAVSLHESTPQEIKDISFPSQHGDSSVHIVALDLPALFLMTLQSGAET